MSFTARILLLGSGELGKELTISLKRLGAYVIACDSYAGAPAMQVADAAEVFPMLDGERLAAVIASHAPDLVVPEVEAIRTEALAEVEARGVTIVPSARATMMTMNRDSIRELAAGRLGLRTSRYRFAGSLEEVEAAAAHTGFPCVVKPVMSSSGKGQSTAEAPADLRRAWDHAVAGMRGDRVRVIVEEFVRFDYEITLLTVRTREGVLFCPPIGHRQERGDYRESWQPAAMSEAALRDAQAMARAAVDDLGGYGVYGVEFFVAGGEVIFSELSPRPHDTGMVTLLSQNLSEFDLHARAILALPIPAVKLLYPAAASAVILADREARHFDYEGLADALALGGTDEVDLRLFGKPTTRPYRRMGIALASAATTDDARRLAVRAAAAVRIRYDRLHL
ncbi:MAG: formate-dependent phosphoribosylglycinamide formyltransferase [Alphaproteobacteria bacterium]|nr:formate-dependent phosphoribosylglycinamide formyltransferase [Alphaproteobacteria bacterium]MBV9371428.1 formate-dependent phosphoribosylglycinamide formyltransferase [Alphaproteobacteria bacterium]MBV9902365.1 formate-dependent phosphoribosylglycinamide formyltransferase [Alphaproteobacteria bacterium]